MAKRRKRGDGSVRLRKDGRWEGRVVVGYDDKGLPITKNVLAKTKGECVDKLKSLKASCGDAGVGEWLDFWYQNYSKPRLRPKTQLDYENCIYQHIIPALGKIPLTELTANDLQQFYGQMKKSGRLNRTELYGPGLSDRMVRAFHTRCSSALDRAVQDGLIRVNPRRWLQAAEPDNKRIDCADAGGDAAVSHSGEGGGVLRTVSPGTGHRPAPGRGAGPPVG